MRIIFLGTAAGVPEPNRKCTCTLIDVGGCRYFIDMGVMAAGELAARGMSVESVKGIFLTHLHGDHADGLINFADIISWYYTKADPVICLPDLRAAEAITCWLKVIGMKEPRPLRYREIVSGLIFEDERIRITAIPTKHCDRSYAFLAEAEGKTVLFCGDQKYMDPASDFPAVAAERDIDLAVCEGAHFPLTAYIPLMQNSRIRKVCIHHYPKINTDHLSQLCRAMGSVPVLVASDGMEVEV